ncbi:cobyrinate a,c-diamide synthase [Alteribacillus sp. HJP-4]|uniref:cobyrinate a,c-diamide synthase n=1 Tax=Alteribacillus sp. HJP-4 TaxID=2775394 RepID=UPI0035CD13E8
MQPRVIIAGTGSGTGKTTITVGLMAAFIKTGLAVQGFKCGPDYIDPSYHTAVTGRSSRNMDSWMLPHKDMLSYFQRGAEGADLSIIEGVMGLYDGKSPESDQGSTAEISKLLQAPVILVVDISSMARSAAAIVKGFQALSEDVNIGGVIVNNAGSEGHYKLCKTAIEKECGVPVVGYLKRGDVPQIPERHLGLIPALERGELDELFDKLSSVMKQQVQLNEVKRIAEKAGELERNKSASAMKRKTVRIAVARDHAFNFYYPENLELLEENGAELLYFSPLKGEPLPLESDALYIGGGFPEEFAAELAASTETKESILQGIRKGMPVYAECGGYMYLCKSIMTTDGLSHTMIGAIPSTIQMTTNLAALGYREVEALHDTVLLKKGEQARGHEFHYSTVSAEKPYDAPHYVKGMRKNEKEGYYLPNVTAGYTHIHFASNPKMAARFVELAKTWRT